MTLSRAPLLLLALLACLTAACDLGTKHWAVNTLADAHPDPAARACEHDPRTGGFTYERQRGHDVVLVRGALELQYAENCAAAFGMLTGTSAPVRRGVLFVGAVLATAVLAWTARRRDLTRAQGAALGVITGGAIGNVVDRVARGYVVDFIHAHWHAAFDWPVFNVADIAIAVGIAWFALESMRLPTERAERA